MSTNSLLRDLIWRATSFGDLEVVLDARHDGLGEGVYLAPARGPRVSLGPRVRGHLRCQLPAHGSLGRVSTLRGRGLLGEALQPVARKLLHQNPAVPLPRHRARQTKTVQRH